MQVIFLRRRDAGFESGCVDDQSIAFDVGFERNGIAAAFGADVEVTISEAAIAADHFGALLIIALGAADGAGVEGGGEGVVRPSR